MRAWVVERPGPIELHPLWMRDLPRPRAGPHEVRLRVEACGVCRTDLHIAEGDLVREHPIVPGHQIVGRVVERGRDAAPEVKEGDRVGVTWLANTCGACEHCAEGRENLCPAAAFTGFDRPGGYAEEAVAHAAFVVPLPAAMKAEHAAPLLCAGVVGYRSLLSTGAGPGDRLGLVGYGASARLTLQAALHLGCEVVVFTREPESRAAARAAGAAAAFDLGESEPAGCHGIVLFAPVGDLVPFALRHLRRGGTLAINAIHLSDVPSLRYALLYEERGVRSVAHLTRRDAREFLELAADARIEADPRVYPFARANEALRDVKESKVNGQAVLDVGGAARGAR